VWENSDGECVIRSMINHPTDFLHGSIDNCHLFRKEMEKSEKKFYRFKKNVVPLSPFLCVACSGRFEKQKNIQNAQQGEIV